MEKLPRLSAFSDHKFTYEYAQPREYRFCQDSVLFPRWVADRLAGLEIGPDYRALDVCAGCGVIGFEMSHYEPRLTQIDFLEIQENFRASFEANLRVTGRDAERFRFVHANYTALSCEPRFRAAYDLIVANPPYFFVGDGKLSGVELQDRCRFFMDASFEELLCAITQALKPNGRAYILAKSGERHGRDSVRGARLALAGLAAVSTVADIRGTQVLQITKH